MSWRRCLSVVLRMTAQQSTRPVIQQSTRPVTQTTPVRSIHLSRTRFDYKKSIRQMKNEKDKDRGYVLLIVPITTFCLGTWQIQRRKWKIGLIEELETRTKAEPVSLPDSLEEIEELEYRKVSVRGRFDHPGELHVMPRTLLEDEEGGGGGLVGAQGKSGAHIVTPFILSDTGRRILVNRGWVPRNKINPNSREEGQISDEVTLVGVVRLNESRPQGGMNNDVARNNWFYRDVETMSELRNTEQIFLDADSKSTVNGGPIGGQTRVTLRNEHLSYILTWYSLSALTFVMWYKRYWARL